MALFGPADMLPPSTRRILVAGASGAGKTTLREVISNALELPTVEIDSLHHGPNWTVRPTFISDVDQFTSGSAWVVEWQYAEVKPLLLSRSDALMWLDPMDGDATSGASYVASANLQATTLEWQLRAAAADVDHRSRAHHSVVMADSPSASERGPGSC